MKGDKKTKEEERRKTKQKGRLSYLDQIMEKVDVGSGSQVRMLDTEIVGDTPPARTWLLNQQL